MRRPKRDPTPEELKKLDNGEWVRASGDAACLKCKKPLFDHVSLNGFPTFVVNCNDRIFKL